MRTISTRERIADISMLLGAATAILISAFIAFMNNCDSMPEKAFRLHILANSDSAYDQRIKLMLRDDILGKFGDIFSDCGSKTQAKRLAQSSLSEIEEEANSFLLSKGVREKAVCTVGTSYFPTRKYSDYTLPAGEYDALKITIGSGEGRNWWCVIYPSVCLSAAGTKTCIFPRRQMYDDALKAAKLTEDSKADINSGIEIKFALYEIIKKLFG